jgi:DNA-binding transcriptional LysR family regulator
MLNRTNLTRIDLNLLVLFEAVLEERHVARAAARLHVTPSAVSHGLGRLRELMQDPLFLRQPKGVVPTERARQLAAPVADILERARQVISRAEKFDPRHSVRRFVIGAPDAVTAVLLPALLRLLRREAPGIDLGARNLIGNFDAALGELDQRTLDVALLPMAGIPGRFASRTLFAKTDFVVVRRAGHPLGRKLTLANYCGALHLVVSASADLMGRVDRELERRGMRRRVVLTVSNFSQAVNVVAEPDLVATMPRLFAARHAPRYRAIVCDPPFPMPSQPISAIAPQAALADAGLAWLMEALERAARASEVQR